MNKKIDKKDLIIRLSISILIVCLGVLSFVLDGLIEEKLLGNRLTNLEKSSFTMYTVDVGQGDAIYLEFSDINMLVDCGPKTGAEKLKNFLNEREVTQLDYLVYTHADEDHIGGGKDIFTSYEVKTLYRPKVLSSSEVELFGNVNEYNVKDTKSYDESIMCAYQEEGCVIKYSFEYETISGEGYNIKFLSPNQDNYSESNDYSAVILVEVNGKKILLQGDAEENVENRLLSAYGNCLDVDILKVSHHGSKTASSKAFLQMLTPEYAFISVGENQWGMPNTKVLENLELAGTKEIYNTLDSGTIAIGINESGNIELVTYKNAGALDQPIILSALFVGLLLTWGLKFEKKDRKSEKNG